MFDKGFFGGLFDFDRNGKLEGFEKIVDFAAFQNMMENVKKSDEKDDKDTDDDK